MDSVQSWKRVITPLCLTADSHSAIPIEGAGRCRWVISFSRGVLGIDLFNRQLSLWGKPTTGDYNIPFKRESTCEHAGIADRTTTKSQKFQFPSNGKARVNLWFTVRWQQTCPAKAVSIPFKRESTCERKNENLIKPYQVRWFQFPSNGKARVNSTHSDR